MYKRDAPRGSSPRYGLIDAIRGFAIVNMIVYHLLYDLFCYYSLGKGFDTQLPTVIWERCICFAFIITAGVSINFSRHGYRRGLIVLFGAVLISALTLIFVPSEMIWFGILHFLGCAILITFALQKVLEKIHPLPGAGISLFLFALLYGLPNGYIGFFGAKIAVLPAALYSNTYLAFLGLPSKGFFSADYFPMLPWIFLFFFGYFLWRVIVLKGWDGFFMKKIPVLDFIGRQSFLIYLLHQPVLFGILYLIFGHF